MLSAITLDFRLAVRRLRAAPLFTTFAVLSLALGVGVTTIAYSVVADLSCEPDRRFVSGWFVAR